MYAAAQSPRSFWAIASKEKCSNLEQVTFYQSQVVVGSRTCSFVFQTIKYLTKHCTRRIVSSAFAISLREVYRNALLTIRRWTQRYVGLVIFVCAILKVCKGKSIKPLSSCGKSLKSAGINESEVNACEFFSCIFGSFGRNVFASTFKPSHSVFSCFRFS